MHSVLVSCFLALSLVPAAFAESTAASNPNDYRINPASIKIEVVEDDITARSRMVPLSDPDTFTPFSGALLALESIVNITTKAWKVIADNKPVVSVNNQYATAVPFGLQSWTMLQQWKGPKGYRFKFRASTYAGLTAVKVDFLLTYLYGGNYNGTGKYLTGVSIVPLSVSVPWNTNFSLGVEVPDLFVINLGTRANPMAGMMIIMNYSLRGLSHHEARMIYFVRGDGKMKVLNSPEDIDKQFVKMQND
ncbi:MAG: hypothetical protein WCS77_08935 [Elusimicrobiaceae bacterium]|jgi:hypothetical protein